MLLVTPYLFALYRHRRPLKLRDGPLQSTIKPDQHAHCFVNYFDMIPYLRICQRPRIPPLIQFIALASLVSSASVNITVDDEQGDSHTGAKPTYSPSDGWSQGATCSGCQIKANPALAFDNTWHDSTVHLGDQPHTITIQFTGMF